jgi:hypothetical protein|tara:strand:+ start:1147 stop:1542 length:396 start_codon:yes stop_codon:yes gene_type:complete
MAKTKEKRPTTRQIDKKVNYVISDIDVIRRAVSSLEKSIGAIENHLRTVVTTSLAANFNLLAKYMEYNGNIESFVELIEKEYENEKKTDHEIPENGTEEQTKRGGTSETGSKGSDSSGTRSLQQGQRRSTT